MNLFNEYENRLLNYLISYMTRISCNVSLPMPVGIIEAELGKSEKSNEQLTSPELLDMITGKDEKNPGKLNLFFEADDVLMPLINWYTVNPIRFNKAERSWLFYFLSDKKADLFLKPIVKQNLLLSLSQDEIIYLNDLMDERRISDRQYITESFIHNFKKLIHMVRQERIIEIDMAVSEEELATITVLPHMIYYDSILDVFYLLAFSYGDSLGDIQLIDLSDIKNIENAAYDRVNEYRDRNLRAEAEAVIKKHYVQTPISVEVLNNARSLSSNKGNMADDRSAYLFSQYETVNYINEAGHLQMNIFYYDFQYEEILRKLLSMGKYVRVLGPDTVVREILDSFL